MKKYSMIIKVDFEMEDDLILEPNPDSICTSRCILEGVTNIDLSVTDGEDSYNQVIDPEEVLEVFNRISSKEEES